MKIYQRIRNRLMLVGFILVGVMAWIYPSASLAAAIRVNSNSIPQARVEKGFLFAGESQVVYRQKASDGVFHLFRGSIDGSSSIDLSANDGGNGAVYEQISVSPDGLYAVYVREQGRRELFSARVDGSLSHRVSTSTGTMRREFFTISPDSKTVAFYSQETPTSQFQLTVSTLEPGETRTLSPDPLTYFPNPRTPVYLRGGSALLQTMAGSSQLPTPRPPSTWLLSADGTQSTRIAENIPGDRTILTALTTVANDETALLFTNISGGSGEWYKGPLSGAPAELLTKPDLDLDAGKGKVTPDGDFFVLTQSQFGELGNQLWRYRIADGTGERIVPAAAGPLLVGNVQTTKDRVVFATIALGDIPRSLYSVPLEGGNPTQIVDVDGFISSQLSAEFKVSADGERVVFVSDLDHDGSQELVSASVLGGDLVRLNPPAQNQVGITSYFITPDSKYVVYSSNQQELNRIDAFTVPIQGGKSEPISAGISGGLSMAGNTLALNSTGTLAASLGFDTASQTTDIWVMAVVTGDVTLDGNLDMNDIDMLSSQLRSAGSISMLNDLNHSGSVDHTDREFLIKELLATNFGDANLDGRFDSSDLIVVFASGKYETDAIDVGWSEGDWNGDGRFLSDDLVLALQTGQYESTTAKPVSHVPEPHVGTILTLSWFAAACVHRSQLTRRRDPVRT